MEITPIQEISEAREAPLRKVELKPTNSKTLKRKTRGLKQACKHLKAAVASLERIPATDFSGQVPHFISELEDILDAGGNSGMEAYLETCNSELRKLEGEKDRAERKDKQEEEYEKLAASDEYSMANEDDEFETFLSKLSNDQQAQLQSAMDILQKLTSDDVLGEGEEAALGVVTELTGEKLEEAMHYYNVQYPSHGKNVDRPINVVDGTSNAEQLVDTLPGEKNESPEQMKTMDQTDNSQQDKTGNDLSNMMKIPSSIKQSLRDEIKKAEKEAKRMDVRDRNASLFYADLARAYSDLLGHLEKGTIYDFKQAQVFAQTLMGPMLHKIPTNVWKFLTNGGETRSLKSYMTDISKKYPITGPRNTIS